LFGGGGRGDCWLGNVGVLVVVVTFMEGGYMRGWGRKLFDKDGGIGRGQKGRERLRRGINAQ
jgi:hypothetical protein